MLSNVGLICLFSVILAAFILVLVFLHRQHKNQAMTVDDMEGHDFEYYCAQILRSNGFEDVQVTRGSGDFGADILASKDGVTYAVQCKCYDWPVGVPAVQEVFAGRAFYDRMVGAVMTNQTFTRPARTLADKLNVLLWDRDVLASMGGLDLRSFPPEDTGR